MPIYEYKCEECGHEFEALVYNAKEESEVCCEKCSSGKISKQLSAFSPSVSGSDGFKSQCEQIDCHQAGGGCSSGKCPFSP